MPLHAPFQNRISSKWLRYTPTATTSSASSSSSSSGRRRGRSSSGYSSDGVRCLAGDDRHVLVGLYGGSLEVWPVCPKRDGDWVRISTLKNGHEVFSQDNSAMGEGTAMNAPLPRALYSAWP